MESIIEFFEGLADFVIGCFLSLFYLLRDVFCYVFDSLGELGYSIIDNAFADVDYFDLASYLNDLHPDIISILQIVDFGYCFSIILGAYLIKFVMGLIPFLGIGRS